jgi:pimeloyl-ACP methyl ester carboxylesterase
MVHTNPSHHHSKSQFSNFFSMTLRSKKRLKGVGLTVLVLLGLALWNVSSICGSLIIFPYKRQARSEPPPSCQNVQFNTGSIVLQGWRGDAVGRHRGTMVYLHGLVDNRGSGGGIMTRYRNAGWDVIAYDNRAHGDSGGDACTYGFYEKEDLQRVLDQVKPGPILRIGHSLGAAVALQAAAVDPRIMAVIAAESFSDLRTVANERAPFFLTDKVIAEAFVFAENQGHFKIDAASPSEAAKKILVPTLLIHGAEDKDTRPEHSQRIHANLAGPKQLLLVPGVGHNHSLTGDTWAQIDEWVNHVIP